MIEVRDLRFAYPDGRLALDGLSLHVKPGDSVGLIGPNGAGKTRTLFLCLCGVLRPKPRLREHRRPPDPADAAKRKRNCPAHVGVVFQNSDDQLFSSTVGEDVAFGPLNIGLSTEEVRQRVAEALGHVGMTGQDERVLFSAIGR